jgi:hypothetical protein
MTPLPHRKLLITAFALGFVSMCFLGLRIIRQPKDGSQDRIENLLKKIQSLDESDVLEAKEELIATGDDATRPLLHVLQELKGDGGSRLKISGGPRLLESLDDHMKSRLGNDIYEILGRIHASEAVPPLVDIMKREEVYDMIQGMSPVMRSLAEIGPASVPQLIDCIDEAGAKTLTSPDLQARDLPDETGQRKVRWIEDTIQLRAILVLRKIGDKRAIPALERVQAMSNNEFIRNEAREAVKTILNN